MTNQELPYDGALYGSTMTDMGRRRGQRTGNLTEKNGSWLLRWYEDSRDIIGRSIRQRVSMTIGPSTGSDKLTRKQAEREAWDRVLSKLDAAAVRPAALITLQQFVQQRFIPDHVEMTLKPAGKDHYGFCLGHIIPILGSDRLRDMNMLRIQDFINAKSRQKLSPQTVKHLKNCLSAIFRHARSCQVWAGDLPTEGLKMPRLETKEKTALTAEQSLRLILALPMPYSIMAGLMIATGLRISEAAGLKWKRLDFATGTIFVAEQYCREHGYQTPKTKKGTRIVPLPLSLASAIQSLRGDAGPDDPVFRNRLGNPIDKRISLEKTLKPAAKRAKLFGVTWHSLRHTNSTLTDASGMTDAERSKLLGHGSREMTMHYTHPDIERARNAVDGIAAAITPPPVKKDVVM